MSSPAPPRATEGACGAAEAAALWHGLNYFWRENAEAVVFTDAKEHGHRLQPTVGFEPTACSLRVSCSTSEPRRQRALMTGRT